MKRGTDDEERPTLGSDQKLRIEASQDPTNGEYTFLICRKCRNKVTDPMGQWENATVTANCPKCTPVNYTGAWTVALKRMGEIPIPTE